MYVLVLMLELSRSYLTSSRGWWIRAWRELLHKERLSRLPLCSEQPIQNRSGHWECDWLLKTKHCDCLKRCWCNVIFAQCSECQSGEIQTSVCKWREQTWPIDPLGLRNVQLEVSERLPHGYLACGESDWLIKTKHCNGFKRCWRIWFLSSAPSVGVMRFKQARVRGRRNRDSLKVAKCLVI